MGGGTAAQGRYLPDGTWSGIPGDALSSVDFIAELKAVTDRGTQRHAVILMRCVLAASPDSPPFQFGLWHATSCLTLLWAGVLVLDRTPSRPAR